MNRNLIPGTIVLHPEFGTGTIVSKGGEYVEVDFKLRGRKTLETAVAMQVMTRSRYKKATPPEDSATVARKIAEITASNERKKKLRAKKAQARAMQKKRKRKAKRKGIQLGPRSGRVGGEKWEWDMTTPNTPLHREGKR